MTECIDAERVESLFYFSNVLVYRLGGSTYECSILRTVGGCIQTVVSSNGFEHNGDAFTDLLTDIIADEFQK
jgi:molecular chaperone DnaK (HSP70)